MKDFKSPKKQRKADTLTFQSEAAAEVADNALETAGRLAAPVTARLETVTEAARAFRQLRVRPQGATSGADYSRAGSPLGQPRSPKKRKATGRLDKEFILKDDKVKRSTDQQGDISQARGMLGQLLFEFGQLELNRDLLEAIKRTESRTGRQSRSNGRQHELDRIAFEYVVSEAAELLNSQMATVAAHSDDLAVQRAVLRAYAVQAIATFADEDDPSDEGEEDDGEGGSGYSSDAAGDSRNHSLDGSPREAGQPTRQQQQQQQQAAEHSSDMEPLSVASHDKEAGHLGLGLDSEEFGGSPACEPTRSVDMLAPAASLATSVLPSGYVEQDAELQGQGEQAGQQQQVGEAQAQGSAPETVSSSVLPDAPTEAALEDTATQQPKQHVLPSAGAQQQGALVPTHAGLQQELAGPFAPAAQLPAAASLLQDGQLHAVEGRSAEGPVQAQSSGLDDVMQQLSDAVDEMLRSPEAVTSRPRPPWLPHGAPLAAAAQDEGGTSPSLLAVQQLFGGPDTGAAAPQSTLPAPAGVAGSLPARVGEPQQQQQHPQQLRDLHPAVAATGGQADRSLHHPPHPGARLHHTTHRPVRAQRRHTLPALKEENSGRGEAASLSGAAGPRQPLRALSPQQTHQREQHSSGGSGGTSQSDAQNEALKRQRTDAADGTTATLHVQQQHPQQDASPPWRAGPASEDQVPLTGQRTPPNEATSPLFEPQLHAGLQPPQQQPQPLQPQNSPEAAAGLLGALPPSPPQQLGLLVPLQAATDGAGGALLEHLGAQQQQGGAAGEEDEGSVEAQGVAHGGGSAWGSTLVCADLTVNDVASKYWPFLRSAMQGQGTTLQDDDTALVASLVQTLGETISMTFALESGGRLPVPETKSLVAATAFDDMFRDKFAQGTSTESK